jgi:membrane protein
MASGSISRWTRIRTAAENFFHEKGIESDESFSRSRGQRIAHFWLLVGKSFVRNRCPVRASALAYTTLLALVPLLAVVMSITTSVLKSRGEAEIQQLVDRMIDYAAPTLDLETRATEDGEPSGREKVVKQINSFIQNINSGTLSATAGLALLFVGISLLRTIEAAFNDIWGVTKNRSWFKSIVYYWAAITLGPIFIVGTIALTTGPHLAKTQAYLNTVPFLGAVFFRVTPFVVLSLGFAAFYAAMPNTRVHWKAALVGGTIGGCLWQLNNMFNVIYVSRAVSYTNIYGSLGVLPLFLVGMYFSWLIMLFGAQVAYAYQNRGAYIEERQAESVNQRGREFIALRMMTHIARNFLAGARPLSRVELSKQLTVPSQLAQKVLCTLVNNGLLVEVNDLEVRFTPARPLDRISAYDVICALRAGRGQELATHDDESRVLVRSEFERMIVAEREAGAAITLQSLAELTAKQVGSGEKKVLQSI